MRKKTILLLGFILLKFLLQYILISPNYDLHRDEFLYLDQANHLAWGYLSVPPFISWISVVIKFLGNSVFWIKFFPALFGALTILVVWKTIEELNGNLFALALGATSVLFSVLLRLNILYQPNSFDVLCWTTFYFIVIKYLKTEEYKWLFAGAFVFAIGFLNKYNIVFMLFGITPALLLSDQRKLLLHNKIYLAILLGLLLILPNLVWQYNNHFPFIHHLKELADTQLVNVDRWNFIESQAMFFIGSLFVIVSALVALLFYKPFKKYKSFFWVFFFTLLVFIYFRAKDYYAIGLYPVYIAFGSVFLADKLNSNWGKYLQPIAIAIPVLFFIPMFSFAFPNKSPEYIVENEKHYKDMGLLRWEDGKDHILPQDFADMLGWRELAQKVEETYSKLPEPEKTLVLCDNYGQAGAINYYTNGKIGAVSFNADYINWFRLDRQYVNLIRVKERYESGTELAVTSPYFNTSTVSDSVANPFAREYRTTIFTFVGAKVDINKRIKEEINKEKNY